MRLLATLFRLATAPAHVSGAGEVSQISCRKEDFSKRRTLSPRRFKAAQFSTGHPVCATRQGISPTPDTDRRRASIYRLEKRPCIGGAGRRKAPITLPEDVIPLSKEKHEHTKKCTAHLLYLQGLADAKAFEPSQPNAYEACSAIEHCSPSRRCNLYRAEGHYVSGERKPAAVSRNIHRNESWSGRRDGMLCSWLSSNCSTRIP